MKQLFTLWVGCLFSLAVSAQPCTPTTTSPFLEDFETFTTGVPGSVANGWTVASTNASTTPGWTVDAGGTGSGGTGPSADHTLGTSAGIYMFTETSSPAATPGDTFDLVSPCIDLAGTTAPRLSFWYHMAGADMGTLNVRIQNGTVDSLVWSLSGPQQLDETDPWRLAIVDLSFFVGNSITIQFQSVAGTGFTSDMAVDDVSVFDPPPIDMTADAVVEPVDANCFTNAEEIKVRVVNFGNTTIDFASNNMTVGVDISGVGAPQSFSTIVNSGTLAVFDSLIVTVTNAADLSGGGFHNMFAHATTTGDPNTANDTTFAQVEGIPLETTPYFEDFESFFTGSPGTVLGGWQRLSFTNAAPTAAGWFVETDGLQNTPNTGPIDDHTTGGSIYMYLESSSGVQGDSFVLISPCVDMAGLSIPRLSFYYHMFGSQTGELQVHVIDGGVSTMVWSLAGQQQTSQNDPWIEATVDLTAFAGASVQLAFVAIRGNGGLGDMAIDDILVYDPPPVDMKAESIVTPVGTGCFSGNEDIIVKVVNLGTAPMNFSVNNMTVGVNMVNGANVQPFSTTVTTGMLPVFDSLDVLVTSSADLSAAGTYVLTAYTDAASDGNILNDTTINGAISTPVFSLPFEEDFETFSAGSPGTLANGWTATSSSNSPLTSAGWFVETDGTTNSGNTGPLDDNTPGGSIYMYTETSGGAQGDSFALVSPCIDLTSQTSLTLLKFYYHMFGADMGELQVHVLVNGTDNMIWSLAGQQQTGENDPFFEQILDLSPYLGNTIQVAFVGIRGASFTSDMAIDDISIFAPPPIDVQANQIITPIGGCDLGTAEQVTVEFINFGTAALNNVVASFAVDGGAQITPENVPGTFQPGDTAQYTFNATADLSTLGQHTITIVVTQLSPADTVNGNDTLNLTFTNFPQVTSFPYSEDFESGRGGWTAVGANSTWAFGTPAKDVIIGAASGDSAWVTGGLGTGEYNANEDSYVIGPCFDFSTLAIPQIELSVWWNSEFSWDGAVLQSSIDAGNTWQNVGAFGDPDNWYTDNTVAGGPGGSQEAWSGRNQTNNGSGGWVQARHVLDGLGGEPEVLLRIAFGADGSVHDDGFAFDNISIVNKPPTDLVAQNFVRPPSPECYDDNETITVRIVSNGSSPLDLSTNPATVNVQVLGPNPNSYSATVNTGILAPLDSIDVLITTTGDFSVNGKYDLIANVDVAGDADTLNDITTDIVWAGFFAEDFETFLPGGNGVQAQGELMNGWTRTSSSNSAPTAAGWFVETDGISNSTGTGPIDDHTPGGSIYMYTETSSGAQGDTFELITPCVTLSGLTDPRLSFWYHMFGVNMGDLSVRVVGNNIDSVMVTLSGPQQNAESDPWKRQIVDLTPFKDSTVHFVFIGIRGSSFQSDMSIDDVELFNFSSTDIEMLSIDEPISGCGLQDTAHVSVTYANVGIDTILTYDLVFSVDGVAGTPETVTDTLFPGDTVSYTFTGTADLSTPGTYNIGATSNAAGDANTGNDFKSKSVDHRIPITTFPYVQDFENGGTLPAGWIQETVDGNQDWLFDANGTPTNNTGPLGDHTPGQNGNGFYAYVEDNNGNNDSVVLVTPCFDVSGLNGVRFSFWYHSNNSAQPNNENELYLDLIDNGDITYEIIPAIGHKDNNWNKIELDLSTLVTGTFAIRFRVNDNNNSFTHDIAIDDIRVDEILPQDIGVSSVVYPLGGCGLTTNDSIVLSLTNYGTDSIKGGFDVSYQINGGPVTTVSSNDTISPNNLSLISFTGVDLSPPNTYNLVAWTSNLNGDSNFFNDTLKYTIESIPLITSYPYNEDFENGAGGWISAGLINTWELTTPANPVINSAASGVNSWITNASGSYAANEDSWVIGPCFDFSTLDTPVISLSIWWNSEFSWDGAVLQSSIDDGNSWQNVGAVGDPNNWYNDNTINSGPGGQPEGWTGRIISNNGSGGWVTAKHDMDSLGGKSNVRLRIAFAADGVIQDDGFAFDDISIFDKPEDDLGVVAFLSPGSFECSSDSTPVTVQIVNFGTQPQSNFPVAVDITGAGVGPISTTVTGPVNPGDTVTVQVGTINTGAGGQFDFTAYTDLTAEEIRGNDTVAFTTMVDISAVSPIVFSDSTCFVDSATFTLIASGTADEIIWYDSVGGNILAVGDTFMTPLLGATTTYYARAANLAQSAVGPMDNTFGPGSTYTFFADGLVFDAYQAFTLNTVRIYPGGAGTVTINLDDAGGANVYSTNFTIPAGVSDTVLQLNWDIEIGVDYEINAAGSTVPNLFRNSGGAVYPYEVPNIMAIKRTINNLNGFYYFFYDWSITALGCPSPFVPVQAVILPPVQPALGSDGIECAGYVLDAFDPGFITYEWNNDPNLTTPTLTIDTTGAYVVKVTDINGCMGADTIFMTINPAPAVNLGPDTTACDVVSLDAGNPGGFYIWSNGNNTQVVDITQSGKYYVDVTVLGCSSSDTVMITIIDGPVVDLGADFSTCDPYTLDATNANATYLWSTGETTPTITVPAPVGVADTISVLVSLPNGCEKMDEIIVNPGAEPVVDLGLDQEACDSVSLDAGNAGATYIWSPGGATTQTITATSSGSYTVVVTDPSGCEGSDTIDVVVNQKPVAGFTDDPGFGYTRTLVNTATGVDSAVWNLGDGSTAKGDTIVHTFGADGTFAVELIVYNECGSDTITNNITTDIDDDLFGAAFSVYPNPTDGEFYIELTDFNLRAEQLTIQVIDARGRMVFDETEDNVVGSYKQKFDLRKHAEGVYLVKISDGDRTAYKRVIRD